ncbi:MAG: hypothetical protein CBC16_08910 [Verrucomicrobia bacterium TMED56]|nr:MAG: hypothetical protein CBC16_08910 [Verrucomicrobia bacterium TMED56]
MKKLPQTLDDFMEMLDAFKEHCINEKNIDKEDIEKRYSLCKNEMELMFKKDEMFVPNEISNYQIKTSLPEKEMVRLVEFINAIKELFYNQELTYEKSKDGTFVSVHTNELSRLGIFKDEVISLVEFMSLTKL